MNNIIHYPLAVFGLSFIAMWVSAWVGLTGLRKHRILTDETREDYNFILSAVLTLLGLVIGFSFSMAITRYDQRKNYEEAEANAIGTEYVRADLLPTDAAMKVRGLLRDYLEQRVLFYKSRNEREVQQINERTTRLQGELWAAILAPSAAQPTPVIALAVSGMNDVLNSKGYTQAAWWNRIPNGAWALMAVIAIACNLLIGHGSRNMAAGFKLIPILPLVIAVAFMVIADIDSPRNGLIRVKPQNLISLADSLR